MIRVGTCSWAEKSLLKSGEFYPVSTRTAEERLRYYSERFPVVEVNSSYYAIPDKNNSASWAARTPGDFIFHIKAYGALTGHGVNPRTLPSEISAALSSTEKSKKFVFINKPALLRILAEIFIDSLAPLIEAGKMGLIVFQFPQWFQFSGKNMEHISFCKELMRNLGIAVEFRHGSWLTAQNSEKSFHFLDRLGIAYVTADEAQFGNLATVPFLPEVTAGTGYFRFHGRNRENWLKKGIETSSRYDYLYSEDELAEFVSPVNTSAAKAKAVYAMFNNCHGSSAIKNAKRFGELIKAKEGLKASG